MEIVRYLTYPIKRRFGKVRSDRMEIYTTTDHIPFLTWHRRLYITCLGPMLAFQYYATIVSFVGINLPCQYVAKCDNNRSRS